MSAKEILEQRAAQLEEAISQLEEQRQFAEQSGRRDLATAYVCGQRMLLDRLDEIQKLLLLYR